MKRHTEFLRRPYCPEDGARATSVPIWQTATFAVDGESNYDYSRSGNPTRRALEARAAALEAGERCCAFASGMAAIAALIAVVPSGGRIVASAALYGGSLRLFAALAEERNIQVDYVEASDLKVLEQELSKPAQLLFLETPSNPKLEVIDIAGAARLAKSQQVILAVDNSMLSPWLQNPLLLGADLVVHSATKFLSGHGDLTAGLVIGNDPDLMQRIANHQNAYGAALSAFESWLLLRGLDTLALRIERQQENARQVAQALREQAAVRAMHWLGFPDHPGHELNQLQARGPGSVLAFEMKSEDAALRVLGKSRICSVVVSFGSLRSTISRPCAMSHASVPVALRARLAPPVGLLRLSVGAEDPDDLIADLWQAMR